MRVLVRALAALTLGAALTVIAVDANAEPGDPTAVAEDLFQRGKAFMRERAFAKACPLLLESYRLDPAGGTLQNLAICYEETGKLASAYARFHELKTASAALDPPRKDRVKLADMHIAKLEPRLARVRLVSNDATEVKIDGVEYLKAVWSAGILLDPGSHELVATAEGKLPFRTDITTPAEGKSEDVVVPPLVDEPVAPPPPPPPVAVTPPPSRRASDDGLRSVGFVVGGVGVAALATGAVFGLLTFANDDAGTQKCQPLGTGPLDSKEFDLVTRHCYDPSQALEASRSLKDEARTFANVANVLIPVGLVAVGVGVYLAFVRRPPPTRDASSSSAAVRLRLFMRSPLLGGAF